MKIRINILWILAFALSLLTSFGVSYLYVQSQLEQVEVIVAREHLSPRTQITAQHLEKITLPKSMLKGAFYTKEKEVLDMYVKIQHSIPKGSLIYQSSLETLDQSIDYPSLMLKQGQALFSLEVDLISTSGKTLQQGQRIDLYGTIKVNRELIVDRVFEQVRVLSILDKNGEELNQNPKQVPKLMLIAIYETYVPILTKLLAMGEVTITPTTMRSMDEECLLNESSPLLSYLYV